MKSNNHKILNYMMILISLTLSLSGCGGDGGEAAAPRPQLAALTVGMQGNGFVGAVDVEIVLPNNFTLETDNNGQPTAAALQRSLSGTDVYYQVNYIPATLDTPGLVKISVIDSDGFTLPEDLFKLSLTYAAGVVIPTEESFAVKLVSYDLTNGSVMSTVSESVTLKTDVS